MAKVRGKFVDTPEFAKRFEDVKRLSTSSITLWPEVSRNEEVMYLVRATDVIVTSGFVVVDTVAKTMVSDQSYTNLESVVPVSFKVAKGQFRLTSRVIKVPGPVALLGGPIDKNWYHWLFNWCLRLIIIKNLNPELLANKNVRFAVHPLALERPFLDVLELFLITPDRCVVLHLNNDYEFETLYVPSFCDQQKLFPDLIRQLAHHLLLGMGLDQVSGRRRTFISRQASTVPRRRVVNFESLGKLLSKFRFRILQPELLSLKNQAAYFRKSDIIFASHGSAIANLIFCRHGTHVVITESQYSVDKDLHIAISHICVILGLNYHLMICETEAPKDHIPTDVLDIVNADQIVDLAATRKILSNVVLALRVCYAADFVSGLIRRWLRSAMKLLGVVYTLENPRKNS